MCAVLYLFYLISIRWFLSNSSTFWQSLVPNGLDVNGIYGVCRFSVRGDTKSRGFNVKYKKPLLRQITYNKWQLIEIRDQQVVN